MVALSHPIAWEPFISVDSALYFPSALLRIISIHPTNFCLEWMELGFHVTWLTLWIPGSKPLTLFFWFHCLWYPPSKYRRSRSCRESARRSTFGSLWLLIFLPLRPVPNFRRQTQTLSDFISCSSQRTLATGRRYASRQARPVKRLAFRSHRLLTVVWLQGSILRKSHQLEGLIE